ncbi:S-layer homology domain-containing protein [Brevibacillus borstelensis]|uniref:S-layer homology domain-containing protein n=1 Tax=Brevibacillus borstelensis TaxID=45462 RepID=UPI001FA9E5ED|nr:S-layer homology domain-containing protein [Brevibacillus borstelensis]
MTSKKQSWKLAAGLTAAVLTTSLPLSAGGLLAVGSTAFAAEAKTGGMTKEEAVKKLQGYVSIPGDFKLERATYLDPERESFYDRPSWRLSWDDGKEGGIYATIDAKTGVLLDYSKYTEQREKGAGEASLEEEAALAKAKEFIKKVAPKDEQRKLSQPNEYKQLLPYYYSLGSEHTFAFTRVENEIPFLENGFQIVVSQDGEVVEYHRLWSDEALPDAKDVLGAAEAEKLLAERTSPSLVFVEKSSLTRQPLQDRSQYQLVYRYLESDPQFLDASSGKALNQRGEEAKESVFKPLGSAVRKTDGEDRVITKEEAQKIADQVIKLLPGSYRSDGNRGSGSSTGPDGIERRNWSFDYTPLHTQEKNVEPVKLRISDRGELIEYSSKERGFRAETGKKIEKAVSYEKASESAQQLVKTLLSDRLGEIYMIDRTPTEQQIEEQLERGQYYYIPFGWMKDGIPIEHAEFEVVVNPETGEAETLNLRGEGYPKIESPTAAKIDREAAKKVEQEQQKVLLTYYQPQANYYRAAPDKQKPLLVYRYVGDRGMVDAVTGEWISLDKQLEKTKASDISDHPDREALQFAVRLGLFPVIDGKVEPDKEVTRGEMAVIASHLIERIEFHRSYSLSSDEGRQPYRFDDVDPKHPLYGVVQKGVQTGLFAKKGSRFEPDRPITRAEVAEFVARLLGYGDLLDKTDIFSAPYGDVEKNAVPAIALVHAFGLLGEKGKADFKPNGTLTRAEAARLVQKLIELKKDYR